MSAQAGAVALWTDRQPVCSGRGSVTWGTRGRALPSLGGSVPGKGFVNRGGLCAGERPCSSPGPAGRSESQGSWRFIEHLGPKRTCTRAPPPALTAPQVGTQGPPPLPHVPSRPSAYSVKASLVRWRRRASPRRSRLRLTAACVDGCVSVSVCVHAPVCTLSAQTLRQLSLPPPQTHGGVTRVREAFWTPLLA